MFFRSIWFFAIVCSAATSGCSELIGADFDDKRVARNRPPSAEDAVLENVVEGTTGNTLQLVASDPEHEPLTYWLTAGQREGVSVDETTGLFSYASAYGAWRDDSFEEQFRYGVRDFAQSVAARVNVRLLPAGPRLLDPPSPAEGVRSYFGASVDFDGDRAIVGATEDGAYILHRQENGTWRPEHKIEIPNDDAKARGFGFKAVLSGDWALVAAYGGFFPTDSPNGMAYFYKRNGAGEYVLASTVCGGGSPPDCDVNRPAHAADRFGWDLALSGTTAAISAKDDDENGTNAGAVYVYELDEGAGWVRVAKLAATDAPRAMFFGSHLALDGDTLAIGAEGTDTGPAGALQSGAVYVIQRDRWRSSNPKPDLLPLPNRPPLDGFRIGPVAVSGDYLICGAPGAAKSDPTLFEGDGLAFVYEREAGVWKSPQTLKQPDGLAGAKDAQFGYAVALDGNVAVVTRLGTNDNGGGFMFRREQQQPGPNTTWALRRVSIVSSTIKFGWSVAVGGTAILVGAPHALPDGHVQAFHFPTDPGVVFSDNPAP